MDRKRLAWRTVQVAFVATVLWFATRLLLAHWADVRALQATLTPSWGRVAWSAGIVLVSYAVLIATWRAMVRAWGSALGVLPAARIWFVSNLGRYVPGKVWQIGAMGVMANNAGVPPEAAVGSSLVIALVNILAGFGVVAVAQTDALRIAGATGAALWVPLLVLLVVTVSLPWTLAPLVRFTARVTKRAVVAPELPAAAIWVAVVGCAAAWMLYGVAFRELAIALLGPGAAGDVGTYVAVFTLSYLAGFLALPVPGGLGVREVSLGALLVGTGLSTTAEATLLVVASRLWLTVLEVLPGLVLLAWPSARVSVPDHHPPTT
jgi:glycosyltransferase 2 family protein